jgi:hypothetical protein
MAGTFTVAGGNTTITFTQTAPTAKMQAIIAAAAHWLFDGGMGNHGTVDAPILFASLTNQDKLDIVDTYIKRIVVDAARAYSVTLAQKTAGDTAIADATANLTL